MIKAFHAYRITPKSLVDFTQPALLKMVEANPAADPTAGQWRKFGFTNPIQDQSVFVGSGGARVICVEIRERVLPGQVLKTAVSARATKLSEMGEIINKKRIAEIRDVVEAELLGKSHIKASTVPVIVTGDTLIIGTGSPKMADDVMSLIRGSCERVLALRFLQGYKGIGAWLQETLRTGHDGDIDPNHDMAIEDAFLAGGSVLLKGEGKSSARFSDTPHDDDAVVAALADGLDQVAELSVQWRDVLSVKITDKLVFKGLKFSDLRLAESRDGQDDADAYAMFDASVWLLARFIGDMLAQLEVGMSHFAPTQVVTEGEDDIHEMTVWSDEKSSKVSASGDIGTSNLEESDDEDDEDDWEAPDAPQSDLDDEEDEL